MSGLSTPKKRSYYQIPIITHHSQSFGSENAVFSIFITYEEPISSTKILEEILSVSFGSYKITNPKILENSKFKDNSFSVNVRVPNLTLVEQETQSNKVPISLFISQPGVSPRQLSVCEYSYKAAVPTMMAQASVPTILHTAQSISSINQTHNFSLDSTKKFSNQIISHANPEQHFQEPSTYTFDPQASSSGSSLSNNLTVNSQTDTSLVNGYDQFSAQFHSPITSLKLQQVQPLSRNLQLGTQEQQTQPRPVSLDSTYGEHKQPENKAITLMQQGPTSLANQIQPVQPGPDSSSNSISPVETRCIHVSPQYHQQLYLDSGYRQTPRHILQQEGQQQTHIYYQQEPLHSHKLPGYETNMAYNTSATPELSGWEISVPNNMGFQENQYHSRVMENQFQLGISDGRTFATPPTSQFRVGMHSMMYSQPNINSTMMPPLVRTTALSQAAARLGLEGISHDALVNESTKASLDIVGSLKEMTEDWTEEELESRRRLVQFKRTQQGRIIKVNFSPLKANEWNNSVPCISCIYWREKKEFFVTSVDCILLLEQLINNKFTVEEKNRIRRNLEGYHPMTVSKSKSSSSNFFKTIMGFEKPKPRNIEKDVKVFQWALLDQALKKIIGKYSADFGGHSLSVGYGNANSYHSSHSIIPLDHMFFIQHQAETSVQPQMRIPELQSNNQAAVFSTPIELTSTSESPIQYGQHGQTLLRQLECENERQDETKMRRESLDDK